MTDEQMDKAIEEKESSEEKKDEANDAEMD
jgi:hypothetical protein